MTSDRGLFIAGGKTGILLLHDVGGTSGDLQALAQTYARAGFTVSCPPLCPVLDGATAEGPDGPGLWLSQADQAIARLKERCEVIVAIGHGYGAMLGLEAARSNAAVQALVLVEPQAWLPSWPGRVAAGLAGQVRQVWLARIAGLLPRLGAAAPLAVSSAGASSPATNGAARLGGDLLGSLALLLDSAHTALPSITQPVLLIQTRARRREGLASAARLQRQLGGRVESIVLEAGRAGADASLMAEAVTDRSIRFVAAVGEEIETRRSNEMRRQRIAARSSAA